MSAGREQAARTPLAELEALYETAPVGLCMVDRDLRYVRINERLAAINGPSPADHIGRTVREVIPEIADVVEALYRKVIDSGEPELNFEIRGETPAFPGDERVYLVSYFPLKRTGQVVGVNTVVQDITARKTAEEKQQRQAQILDQVHDAVSAMSLNGTVRTWNRAARRLYGYEEHEVVGRKIEFLFFEEDRPRLRSRVMESLERDGYHEATLRSRKKTGEEVYVEARLCLLKSEGDQPIGLIGCCHDVTEKRTLREDLLKATAQEQRRIGRELHDGTGQELTGLRYLAFSHVRALTERCPAEVDTAVRLAEGLQRALQQVRTLSKGLLPVKLDADGLMAGLTELTVHVGEMSDAKCSFVCDEAIPVMDHEVATQLYRIAQEALTNAVKHARADRVEVRLARNGRSLRLEVTDDGVGTSSSGASNGLGLKIMASRAELIGATFEVGPGKRGGTRVACCLPWGQSPESEHGGA